MHTCYDGFKFWSPSNPIPFIMFAVAFNVFLLALDDELMTPVLTKSFASVGFLTCIWMY